MDPKRRFLRGQEHEARADIMMPPKKRSFSVVKIMATPMEAVGRMLSLTAMHSSRAGPRLTPLLSGSQPSEESQSLSLSFVAVRCCCQPNHQAHGAQGREQASLDVVCDHRDTGLPAATRCRELA